MVSGWEIPRAFMAKAVGVNGKRAAVIDLRSTDPEGWANVCTSAFKRTMPTS